MKLFSRGALVAALAFGIAGCDGAKPARELADRTLTDGSRTERMSTIGDMTAFNRATEGANGGAVLINKHLWRATLDTLSFMPLMSTDPFSGVIATDWTTNADAPGERTKVSAFVTGLDLEARSLKVAIYREVKSPEGDWISAPVAQATPRRLEDLILTRARQMRVQDLEGKAG